MFVANPTRTVALWNQVLSDDDDAGMVVWDYHVILLATEGATSRCVVYDFDSRLPFPCAAEAYIDGTFRLADAVAPTLQPLFRVVDADVFLGAFASDRRHMRADGGRGAWLTRPPPWPAIVRDDCEHNLDAWRCLKRPSIEVNPALTPSSAHGEVVTLVDFWDLATFGPTHHHRPLLKQLHRNDV